MKKTIILNLILILGLALLITAFIYIAQINFLWNEVERFISYLSGDILDTAKEFEKVMFKSIIPEIFIGICILINLITIAIIDIPLLKILHKTNITKQNNNSNHT